MEPPHAGVSGGGVAISLPQGVDTIAGAAPVLSGCAPCMSRARMLAIIDALVQEDAGLVFSTPVPDTVPGYHECVCRLYTCNVCWCSRCRCTNRIVLHPMDLGTVRRLVKDCTIKQAETFKVMVRRCACLLAGAQPPLDQTLPGPSAPNIRQRIPVQPGRQRYLPSSRTSARLGK